LVTERADVEAEVRRLCDAGGCSSKKPSLPPRDRNACEPAVMLASKRPATNSRPVGS
jgi:hypothetical protein